MKWLFFFFLIVLNSWGAWAFSPNEYAVQILQKDVPRSLRWFGRMNQAQQLSQVEVYELYRSALPETQVNQQLGISVKGSIERMILLLEGARYFEQIQKAPVDFQNKKEIVARILQASKDEMDRFQIGEDPQVLLDEWQTLGVADFEKFAADLVETFAELQRLLNEPVMVVVEHKVDAQEMSAEVEAVAASSEALESEVTEESDARVEVLDMADPIETSFEKQRLHSYIESAEGGQVADECKGASLWATDQAESCQSDDSLECDRSYARQCKKLQ